MASRKTMGVRATKTKDGMRYVVRWSEFGRDRKKVMPAGSTKEQAEDYLRDHKVRRARIKAGLEVRDRNPEKLIVRTLVDKWMKAKGKRGNPRNERDILTVKAHVLNTPLASLPIDRVTTAIINAHLADLQPSTKAKNPRAHLSVATKNHVRKHLVSIFALAIARGWLAGDNPAKAAERGTPVKPTIVALTPEESMALMTRAPPPWDAIIACGLLGLRRGEIWGLNVEDVDLDRNELRVRRSHNRSTKSGHERVVSIHSAFRRVIKQAIQMTQHDVLFPANKKGERRSEKTKGQREFAAALKAAGITRHVRFHDLRHTAATILLQSGASIEHVRRILGHSSIAITSGTYSHLVNANLAEAIDRMPFKPLPLALVSEAK